MLMFMNRHITPIQAEWKTARDELIRELDKLGYPAEFGAVIAKNLGSPKAIRRMSSYLRQVRPKKPEMIADEMLAIQSDRDRIRDKHINEHAQQKINILYRDINE